MITYQVETIDDVRPEIEPMFDRHYAEIATDQALKPLVIAWERYYELEMRQWLRIFTAREDDGKPQEWERGVVNPGKLVGYFVTFICPNLHYSQTRIALNDIFYVEPEYRKGTIGYRLMKEAAADLKNLNCDILTIHMKTDYPFRNLLIRQGFRLTEENWEKVL